MVFGLSNRFLCRASRSLRSFGRSLLGHSLLISCRRFIQDGLATFLGDVLLFTQPASGLLGLAVAVFQRCTTLLQGLKVSLFSCGHAGFDRVIFTSGDSILPGRRCKSLQIPLELLQRRTKVRGADLPLFDRLGHLLGNARHLANFICDRLPVNLQTAGGVLGGLAHQIERSPNILWQRSQASH